MIPDDIPVECGAIPHGISSPWFPFGLLFADGYTRAPQDKEEPNKKKAHVERLLMYSVALVRIFKIVPTRQQYSAM